MATPTRPLLADRDQDVGQYQPLSILAIAATAVVGLFTALVLLLMAVGLLTRKPVLEPFVILLDVVGLALALVARWQIRASEGTRAGLNLTRWALGLGVLFGCVYVAYYFGNVLAIRQQAREFSRAWLTLLEKKDVKQAFYLSNPPAQLKGRDAAEFSALNPEALANFRNVEIIRVFERAKEDEIVIEPLGMYDWKPTTDGLVVTLNYLVRTREGEFDLSMPVIGSEEPGVSGRQWYVRATAPLVKAKRLTPYGRFISELHATTFSIMQDWLSFKLNAARLADTYLEMEPLTLAQRKDKSVAIFARTTLAPPLAAILAPGAGLQMPATLSACYLPDGYPPLIMSLVTNVDSLHKKIEFKDPPPSQSQVTQDVRERIRAKLLRPGAITPALAMVSNPDIVGSHVEVGPDAIRSWVPVDFVLPVLSYRSRGQLYLVCTDRALVDKVNALANDKTWDKNQPVLRSENTSVLAGIKHDWTIDKIVVGLERSLNDMRPGGGMPINTPPR